MNQRWHYDEMKQVGTDYADAKEVEAYDARMRKIRDIRSETEKILESLHITQDQTLLEIGCGTGEFAIAAAGRCKKIIAADVSLPMNIQESRLMQWYRSWRFTTFRISGK